MTPCVSSDAERNNAVLGIILSNGVPEEKIEPMGDVQLSEQRTV